MNVEDVVSLIGYFFFENARGGDIKERVDSATKEINLLGITNVSLSGHCAVINLMRPGLLIGRHGEQIDRLTEYLCKTTKGEVNSISVWEEKKMKNIYDFQVALEYVKDN